MASFRADNVTEAFFRIMPYNPAFIFGFLNTILVALKSRVASKTVRNNRYLYVWKMKSANLKMETLDV